jgi:beta-lactam-binding protein with PASTA domain
VPLLDGKYEILAERTLHGGATRFEATGPSGERVRVVWYEVAADDEAAFERYRRLLKGLARTGGAAVADVVSRPGARYVAWRIPSADLAAIRDPTIEAAIDAAGFDPRGADLRRDGRAVVLVDLPFVAGAPTARPGGPRVSAERDDAATKRTDPGTVARSVAWRVQNLGDTALSWLVAAALVALALAAAAGGFLARANDRVVSLPDLVGTSADVAAARLAELGLRVESVPVAAEGGAGEVLALDPAPGTALRPGRSVRLTYAVAPGRIAPVTVPQLVGLADAATAAARLDAVGLRLGQVGRVHADAPAEAVIAQSVPAATTAGRGQEIDVLTSLGPRPATTFLPDLVGLDVADAQYLASVAGLGADQVVVELVQRGSVPPGRVVSQSPAAHVRVPRTEATLRLLVAADLDATAAAGGLPPLAGLPLERARALATGFDVQVETIEDRTLPDGVILQSLAPGARPGEGPLVLTVNVRPIAIPVPVVRAIVRTPELRRLTFSWPIEPGIPQQVAEVRARTLQGEDVVVARRTVRGGDVVSGTWTTLALGPVRFTLTLNGEPYSVELLVP